MKIRVIKEISLPRLTTETHACFISMTPADGGGYHSAYREFTPDKPGVERSDLHSCQIRYQRYSDEFEPIGGNRLLKLGSQDPRAFGWKGQPYAIALNEAKRVSHHQNVYENVVIDLVTGEIHAITSDLDYQGKNWMPVPDGDRLYFVRSVDPLCVVECDERWHCKTVIEPWHADIGQYRGGGAATIKDGIIIGYGHKTVSSSRHTPFKFMIDLGRKQVEFLDIEPVGFAETILDPTCIVKDGRLLLTCSKHAWHVQHQAIPTYLCEIIQ